MKYMLYLYGSYDIENVNNMYTKSACLSTCTKNIVIFIYNLITTIKKPILCSKIPHLLLPDTTCKMIWIFYNYRWAFDDNFWHLLQYKPGHHISKARIYSKHLNVIFSCNVTSSLNYAYLLFIKDLCKYRIDLLVVRY